MNKINKEDLLFILVVILGLICIFLTIKLPKPNNQNIYSKERDSLIYSLNFYKSQLDTLDSNYFIINKKDLKLIKYVRKQSK